MADRFASPGHGDINALILQGLIRKLIARKLLSQDDVRDVLFEAATHLDVLGNDQTPEAARVMVEEELAPVFLGQGSS